MRIINDAVAVIVLTITKLGRARVSVRITVITVPPAFPYAVTIIIYLSDGYETITVVVSSVANLRGTCIGIGVCIITVTCLIHIIQ